MKLLVRAMKAASPGLLEPNERLTRSLGAGEIPDGVGATDACQEQPVASVRFWGRLSA
jgi:hypothetical protein